MRIKSIIKLAVVMLAAVAVMAVFSGCGEITTNVESLMKITSDFTGERVVTLRLEGDLATNKDKAKQLETVIKEGCPQNLSYRTEVADGKYSCVFVLSFTSLEEYKTKASSIVGRQISVAYGYTDSALAKGTYYQEDYDGMELVKWLSDDLYQKGYKDLDLKMQSTSNVIKYNNEVLNSESSVLSSSTVKGEGVHSITIDTVNYKNSVYDRTMVLSVSRAVYDKLGEQLTQLMASRINPEGSGKWSENNGYMDFTASYKNIDLERLQEYTKLFLDCRNENIYYGDQNKSSTPLAEQLVFEERINLLSFVSDQEGNVALSYNYTLPQETTHGEGVVLKKGSWTPCGEWANSTYRLSDNCGAFDIRVPDGMQYTVKGINVSLTSLGNDAFKRVVDFVYDRSTGEKGMNYAYGFLADKGFTVSKESTSDGLVCRITQQGSSTDINAAVGDLFGSGNSFETSHHTNDMSVVTDLSVTDTVNITHMLTGVNSNINMDYTVKSESGESIRNINISNKAEKSGTATVMNDDGSYTSTVSGGSFVLNYTATEPYASGIIMYCVICGVIILIALATIALLFKYNQKLKYQEIKKQLAETVHAENEHSSHGKAEPNESDDFLSNYKE